MVVIGSKWGRENGVDQEKEHSDGQDESEKELEAINEFVTISSDSSYKYVQARTLIP